MKVFFRTQIPICCIFLFMLSDNCIAQSSTNYLQLDVLSSLDFDCSTASSIENTQTITNAFSLKVKTNSSSCRVYVKLSSWTHPAGYTPPSCPIQVDYTSTTSPNATNIAKSPITVTTSSQLLFKQPKTSGTTTAYYFYYDMHMLAIGYDYVPGTYNYTLLFTMTQP